MTLFRELAQVSSQLAGTRSRLEKKRLLVELLARMPRGERGAAVGWLVAEPACGPLGVGPAQLWELARRPPQEGAPLSLPEVERDLDEARSGDRHIAFDRVGALVERMSEPERAFFAGALTGSLRQGSLGGVMTLALAELSERPVRDVEQAVLVTGSIVMTARALLDEDGARSLESIATLVLFRPLAPMLAASAESIEEALALFPRALVEWKVDGVRAQVHKKADRIAIYTRQGHEITEGCAELVGSLASLPIDEAVFDGEVVLVGPDGKPRAFQDSFSAIASKAATPGNRLRLFLFDCLYRNGVELLREPLSVRVDALEACVPSELRMPNLRPESAERAMAFAAAARADGHEGVMVKDLDSPYRLGSRGRAWQKVKEFTTADLVVLAAEWGHGRRNGWLSNLHLGARRDDGSFCMVGKTFKGLTDELLRWQTIELERRATRRTSQVVAVRAELVVEIRFNEVQRSSRYPGGVALRFARVVRYRPDKAPSEADLLSSLVARLPEPAAGEAQPERQLTLF
jgi:DNA ligase-1